MKNLKAIIRTDAAFDILDSSNCAGSDWGAGGCAILASALNKLAGYPIYVIYNEKFGGAEHFGVMTKSGSILDADGEHPNREAWIKHFEETEMPRPGELVAIPYGRDVGMEGVKFDDKASEELAELIKSHQQLRETVRGILKEEMDKMSSIDLKPYYQKHSDNKEWLQILSKFPETLQREIVDEYPEGDSRDIEEIKKWNLNGSSPVKISTSNLLKNKENLGSISRTPQDVIDHINKVWGLGVKQTQVYDQNPSRYFKYAKMSPATAKPSVMVNGEIIWGVARFISALIRGDKTINVWDIKA